MAAKNLHLAKTTQGEPLQFSDIRIGVRATFPSGAGGVITCECKELAENKAVFVSTHKDWPATWTIELGAQDLSLYDLKNVSAALRAMDGFKEPVTAAQQELLQRARGLGYVAIRSGTQAQWTEHGVATLKRLTDAVATAEEDGEVLNALLRQVTPTEDFYELQDCIDDLSTEQKTDALAYHLTADHLQ